MGHAEDPGRAGAPALALVLAVGAVACSGGKDRDLARYYDPRGLFTASLPAGNTVTVSQPQQGGPGILSGVVSRPPAQSPSPQGGLGGIGASLAQTTPADQTVYEVSPSRRTASRTCRR